MTVKEMTLEELNQLEQEMGKLRDIAHNLMPLMGKHFQNEECLPLHRVHQATVTAEVGIRHFLMESATATKWRAKK